MNNKELMPRFVIKRRLCLYLIFMMVGIVLRTYVTHSVTIVWVINLMGVALLFLPYFRYISTSISGLSLLYIIFGIITLLINASYLTSSLKSIGTNINIIIFPLMLNIAISERTKEELNEETLVSTLRFISILGTISFLFAWVVDFQDIVRVFGGASAYKVEVAGFYYSKNIYGAFISLTLASDLYFLTIDRNFRRIIIVGLKILAVVLSLSRAALLQAGIMLFIFFWTKKRRILKDYLVLALIVLACVAGLLYVRSNVRLYNFVLNSVFRVSSGDAGRQMLRNQAIERVSNNNIGSIFGVGFAGMDALDIDIDNTYLYVWFTGGAIKLLFYVWVMILAFKHTVKLRSRDGALYRLCLAVGISYLFFAFFESVAVLELGLLNFLFTIYMFMIPLSYFPEDEDRNVVSVAS